MDVPPKSHRLAEIYRRLQQAPPATTAEEAFQQLADIMNDVEDALTAIPYNPENWRSDGRIYPPQPDSEREVGTHPGVRRYRSVGHSTFIASNGAIEIRRIDQTVEFAKAGADGRGVWDL